MHSRWSFVIARFKSFAFGPQASHRYVFVVFVQGTSESDAGVGGFMSNDFRIRNARERIGA